MNFSANTSLEIEPCSSDLSLPLPTLTCSRERWHWWVGYSLIILNCWVYIGGISWLLQKTAMTNQKQESSVQPLSPSSLFPSPQETISSKSSSSQNTSIAINYCLPKVYFTCVYIISFFINRKAYDFLKDKIFLNKQKTQQLKLSEKKQLENSRRP